MESRGKTTSLRSHRWNTRVPLAKAFNASCWVATSHWFSVWPDIAASKRATRAATAFNEQRSVRDAIVPGSHEGLPAMAEPRERVARSSSLEVIAR